MTTEGYCSRCSCIEELQVLQDEHDGRQSVDGLTTELTQIKLGLGGQGQVVEEVRDLKHLVQELHRVFESDHVNVDYVRNLMSAYKSNPADWRKFSKFDRYRYTRNLVDAGNDKFNLMILCWGEGHGSAIHDHADAHCFMKMLQGQLTETRFQWPEGRSDESCDSGDTSDTSGGSSDDQSMVESGRTTLEQNAVCYINDSLGLHRVENPSHTDVAISLHLYSPPFDACSVFNQQTGQRTTAKVTFWSIYGKRKNKITGEEDRIPEDN